MSNNDIYVSLSPNLSKDPDEERENEYVETTKVRIETLNKKQNNVQTKIVVVVTFLLP